jgi:fluoride ion exporter CrcB/FEX
MAPLGTYLRWYLSRLNGSIRSKNWEWLPIGTLMANLFASSVSAMCAAILLSFDSQSLEGAFFKAFQSGFAGCCSTVSTFASETTGLLRALPRAFWGYYYGFGSMASALLIAVLSYVWAVI